MLFSPNVLNQDIILSQIKTFGIISNRNVMVSPPTQKIPMATPDVTREPWRRGQMRRLKKTPVLPPSLNAARAGQWRLFARYNWR